MYNWVCYQDIQYNRFAVIVEKRIRHFTTFRACWEFSIPWKSIHYILLRSRCGFGAIIPYNNTCGCLRFQGPSHVIFIGKITTDSWIYYEWRVLRDRMCALIFTSCYRPGPAFVVPPRQPRNWTKRKNTIRLPCLCPTLLRSPTPLLGAALS